MVKIYWNLDSIIKIFILWYGEIPAGTDAWVAIGQLD